MRILAIGDIVGRPGRVMARQVLPDLISRENIDFVIANGENAAGGVGLTSDVARELLSSGIDVLTSGNHVWDKKEAFSLLDQEPRILRPLNYPPGNPGRGSGVYESRRGFKVGVLNLNGRVFFGPDFDCPFRTAERALAEISGECRVTILDFHAEATSEKTALARYLDGKLTAVLGTHTHVQTADETVLPKGTAFISDLGMTGPVSSVIGIKTELVLRRFLLQIPVKFEVAGGPRQFSAAIIDADAETGRARSIARVQIKEAAF